MIKMNASESDLSVKSSCSELGSSASQVIIRAGAVILGQGEELLQTLSDAEYSRALKVASGASIGGHYRHVLDHFESLLKSTDADVVNYDQRERNSETESICSKALLETRRILAGVESITPDILGRPMDSRCQVGYERTDSPLTRSSLGRELVYVVAHAIHHYALIKILAGIQEVELPSEFGVAPSTLTHRDLVAHKS